MPIPSHPDSNHQCFLVGGAVRDQYLGWPVHDRDWVVVGATVKVMSNLGFTQVGQDFPVFLHPTTREEYALARKERKTGQGYAGFSVDADPTITLEEDLKRRDLTINAMALDERNELIDPYNGLADIKNKVLRHISPAFVEDPLRVLRVARFYARYRHLGFTIAPETLELMRTLSLSGELKHLAAERLWQETQKALGEKNPAAYFEALQEVRALEQFLPEVSQLEGIPQTPRWHPEIDTFIHVMQSLQASAHLTEDLSVRFAVLVHDLGKGITPKHELPQHKQHEHRGMALVKAVCDRLKVSKADRDLALKVCKDHLHFHMCFEMRAKTLLALLKRIDALRQPRVFSQWLLACEADKKGRGATFEDWQAALTVPLPNTAFFQQIQQAAAAVQFSELESGLEGAKVQEALDKRRIKAIQEVIDAFDTPPKGS